MYPTMKIYLAPMEGVVDHHMRYILSLLGGIDLCVTEFIRITDHTLPRRVFLKSCPELTPSNEKQQLTPEKYGAVCPTRVQLLGSNPGAIALNAKKAAKLGAPAIDLNFGCPAKTVNRNRGGACLLDETHLIFSIVQETRKQVPKETPVTVKIRLGYEQRDSYIQNAKAIEKAGANELVVHARSKRDGYNPPAYWSCIKEIRETISIPVIANGEIWTVEDYIECAEKTGCDNFMLGRGLLARPDLGLAIKAQLKGEDYEHLSWQNIAKLLHMFFLQTSKCYNKKHMGNRVKQWLFYLKRNYVEANQLFDQIKKSKDFHFINQHLLAHCETEVTPQLSDYQKSSAVQ